MNTPEAPVSLRCDDCGDWFQLSARQARTIRNDQPGYVCQRCRATRRKRPRAKVTQAERQYWIDRFGVSGAVELSRAIWPPPAVNGSVRIAEPQQLVASAQSR